MAGIFHALIQSLILEVAGDLLGVAFFFGKDATAVFLHVETEFAGLLLPIAETFAKVAIEEFDAGEF